MPLRSLFLVPLIASAAAATGCTARAEAFSPTAAPHGDTGGLGVALLGLDQTRSSLSATLRIDNGTDQVVTLPADGRAAHWASLHWEGHQADGLPSVDALTFESDWPHTVDVRTAIRIAPFSSRVVHVDFRCRPALTSLTTPCSVEVSARVASTPVQVGVTVPAPRPAVIPEAPWFGG